MNNLLDIHTWTSVHLVLNLILHVFKVFLKSCWLENVLNINPKVFIERINQIERYFFGYEMESQLN